MDTPPVARSPPTSHQSKMKSMSQSFDNMRMGGGGGSHHTRTLPSRRQHQQANNTLQSNNSSLIQHHNFGEYSTVEYDFNGTHGVYGTKCYNRAFHSVNKLVTYMTLLEFMTLAEIFATTIFFHKTHARLYISSSLVKLMGRQNKRQE